MKLMTVVGARPQFIKSAMLSRAIQAHNTEAGTSAVEEIGIHTGQHYDHGMSTVFYEQLDIPPARVNLGVGSGTHAQTTGDMLIGLEREIINHQPDWVVLFGDTNSTLAGALAAAKLGIPMAHVEAGLRSHNPAMPEEINRITTDVLARILFCPTRQAVKHLELEGITDRVHHVGDVMYDAVQAFGTLADKQSGILETHSLVTGDYFLATVHRAENTDHPDRLRGVLEGLVELSRSVRVICPLHPRTRKCIDEQNLGSLTRSLDLIEPVPFLDMIKLERHARAILTDSGGIQKEAYFHRVPCITLRDETEWVETVDAGWNTLVGANSIHIGQAIHVKKPDTLIDDYGNGQAAELILEKILNDPAS